MRQSMGAQSGSRPRSRGGRPSKGPRHQVVGRVPLPTRDDVDRAVKANGAENRSDWIGVAVMVGLRHPAEMRAGLDVLYGRSGAQLRLPTQADQFTTDSLFSVHDGHLVVNPHAVAAVLDGNLTTEAVTRLLQLSLELARFDEHDITEQEILDHSDPVGGPGPLKRVLGRVPPPTLDQVDRAVVADGAHNRSDWVSVAVMVGLRHPAEMRAGLNVLYGRSSGQLRLPTQADQLTAEGPPAALFSVHNGSILVDPRAVAAVLDGSLSIEAFTRLLQLSLELVRFDDLDITEQEVFDRSA